MGDHFMALLIGIVMGAAIAYTIVSTSVERSIMHKAYEHGVAVQCLGKKGYHFKCEGDKTGESE